MGGDRSPEAIQAEAAAWLARLRWEDRTAADEAGFRAWLQDDPRHSQAFDAINTAWESAAAGFTPALPSLRARRRRRRERLVRIGLGLGLATAAGIAGWMVLTPGPPPVETFQTQRGVQQKVALGDGSALLLDTSTLVRATLGPRFRTVELVQGRAHFDVAKDENRPFVVVVGARRVVAVGTSFDVARETSRTSVLLTHGKVLVEDARGPRLMSPGDRVTFNGDRVVADHPNLFSTTAWQSGRAVFEAQPLSAVVAELNRYTRRPLIVTDPEVGAMRISGSYRAGDPEAFATSVATLLPVEVRALPDRISLSARRR